MRIPLRFATALALAGCVLVIAAMAWIAVRAATTSIMAAQGRRHLEAATELGARDLQSAQGIPLDSLAATLALATGYRVSVFDSGRRLLADSHLPAPPPDDSLGYRSRTEVAGALSRVRASSNRRSTLDNRGYLFSAARLYRGGQQIVVRFGVPTDPIRAAAGQVALRVALWILVAGGLGGLVFDRGVRGVARILHDIRRLLARIGDSRPAGARVRLPRLIELARVASAANRVRGELEEQVARVTRVRDELAQLMDEVGEGLMALTNDARVLRINPAALELLGLAELLPLSPVGSIVRDPVLRELLEMSVTRPEGRMEVTVGDRRLDVRTKRGTGGGAVVLIVDITEIRRLEEVRSDFVANASHELKTPLTVIRAAAETVLDEELPSDLRGRFLHSIEENTVRLQRLVDDLLDLSRYESGAWIPERERFPVEDVAWSAWTDMEERRVGRDVAFAVDGRGEAVGDQAATYQIFRNLFENALRFVPREGGGIAVEIFRSGAHLTVAVRDNGSGIPAAALPRIFERFYRVDTARSRVEGGTGLGLAIVRHLVSSMGGEVDAQSIWGGGATILFTVPAAEGRSAGGSPGTEDEAAGERKAAGGGQVGGEPAGGSNEGSGDGQRASADAAGARVGVDRGGDERTSRAGSGPMSRGQGVPVAPATGDADAKETGLDAADAADAGEGGAGGPGRVLVAIAALLAGACLGGVEGRGDGVIEVGGSGSLRALSAAVAEDLAAVRPGTRIAVRSSGTVGGLRRLCSGELDVAGASRLIATAEAERCRAAGIRFLSIPIARDGVAVAANPASAFPLCMTLDELRRLWEPASEIARWQDLRPAYPAERVRLFGPGPGSGTFEFFTRVVVGRTGASRSDYYPSNDHNLIARGIGGNRWAAAYFGSASLAANAERLRAVAVDTGFGCVLPTVESIADGRYSPLTRDLRLYVAESTLARAEVRDFLLHYIDRAAGLGRETGYVALPEAAYARSRALIAARGGGVP